MATDTGIFRSRSSSLQQQSDGEEVEVFCGDLWAHMDLQFQEQLSTSRIRRERSGFLWSQTQEPSIPGAALYIENQTGKKWRCFRYRDTLLSMATGTRIFCFRNSSLQQQPDGKEVEVFCSDLWAHIELLFQDQLSTARISRERSGGVSSPQSRESSVPGTGKVLYNDNQTGRFIVV